MKKHLRIRFVLALLAMLLGGKAAAQSNYLDMDDECFELYQKTRISQDSALYFDTSTRLRALARSKNDFVGELYSYILLEKYYDTHFTPENYHRASQDTRDFLKRSGNESYKRYYYRNYSFEALRLIEEGHFTLARQCISNYHIEAKEDDMNPYGLFYSNYRLGYLYDARYDNESARYYYEQALKIMEDFPQHEQEADLYCALVDQLDLNDEVVSVYLKRALNVSNSIKSKAAVYSRFARQAYAQDNKERFRKYFELWKNIQQHEYIRVNKNDSLALTACLNALNGDYVAAYNTAMRIKDVSLRCKYGIRFALQVNDYEKAYHLLNEKLAGIKQSVASIAQHDIDDLEEGLLRDNALSLAHQETVELKNLQLQYGYIVGIVLLTIMIFIGVMLYQRNKDVKRIDAMNEELVKANESQTRFLQNMSHEVRTPLNAICGLSQIVCEPMMREFISDEELVEYSQIIRSNTEMLVTLVTDILEVGDIQSGKYKIHFDTCSPNDIARNAHNTVQYRCQPEVKMFMTTDVSDDMTIWSDEKRIEQILINFLTNSTKHTEEGTIHIHVTDKERPGYITFSVTDTGEGIPKDKADKIFNRFEKLDTFKQGTGLGLHICQSLGQLLHGEVVFDKKYKAPEGSKNPGARFFCVIPVDYRQTLD